MRFLKLFLILNLILLSSCEVPFNPEAEFEEEYIINAVIDCDTSYQRIYIQKSYNPDNFNLTEYGENTFISGAIVYLSNNETTYLLHETIIQAENNDRYKGQIPVYETYDFQYTNGDTLYLRIDLPDGKRLESYTIPPQYSRLRYSFGSDYKIPDNDGFVNVEWELLDASAFGQMYLRELKIAYIEEVNGENVYDEMNIPLNYIDRRGELIPNYPLPENTTEISYSMDAIDKTMELISEGEPDKSKFTILNAKFQVVLFDQNLAPYYMSTETFLGGYTVILDRIDYSNITGGFGIFASFRKETMDTIIIDPIYINSFGYRHQ